ncbi:MAG: hypothetical protein C0501_30585 [Isosphaera sp.]|nr:hypothetical protein [Isosphaera sp.]
MPSVPRSKKGVYVELPPDLVDRARAFAAGRGEPFAAVVAAALARHLANPPARPEDVPLPPVTAPAPTPPAKAARKGKAPRPGKKGKPPAG